MVSRSGQPVAGEDVGDGLAVQAGRQPRAGSRTVRGGAFRRRGAGRGSGRRGRRGGRRGPREATARIGRSRGGIGHGRPWRSRRSVWRTSWPITGGGGASSPACEPNSILRLPVADPAPTPAGPHKICHQHSITLHPEAGAQHHQHLDYGSPTWQQTYFRLRNSVEAFNGFAKDTAYEAIEQPGRLPHPRHRRPKPPPRLPTRPRQPAQTHPLARHPPPPRPATQTPHHPKTCHQAARHLDTHRTHHRRHQLRHQDPPQANTYRQGGHTHAQHHPPAPPHSSAHTKTTEGASHQRLTSLIRGTFRRCFSVREGELNPHVLSDTGT